jgi:uncharacterized membrane protein YfcA
MGALHLDGLQLGLFLAAAFFGGLTSGLSGFAMGLVVSGVWLHIITPDQNATLIVFCGLVTQGYGIWRVRNAIQWPTVAPFIIGGAIGVPVGTALLTTLDRASLRTIIGALLVAYSLYSLLRPAIKPARAGLPADLAVGIVNGLIGGLTGLGGIAVTIWCQLVGGPKDAQRAIFQPVLFATFVMSAISLGVVGGITGQTARLYLLSLPALVVGLWCGFRLYGKLDDAAFRKVILTLLLVSGMSLVVPVFMRG